MRGTVEMTWPHDLSALQLPSPHYALRLGDLVTTVGGKANNALLVLLKESKRKHSLLPKAHVLNQLLCCPRAGLRASAPVLVCVF